MLQLQVAAAQRTPVDLQGLTASQAVQEDLGATMITRVKTAPVGRPTVELPEDLKAMQAQEEQTRPTLPRIEAGTFQPPKQPSRLLRTRIPTPTGPSGIT